MLKQLTSQGNWLASGKNIKTTGGTFVGYASKESDAKIMALSGKLLELLYKRSTEKEQLKELEELLKTGG